MRVEREPRHRDLLADMIEGDRSRDERPRSSSPHPDHLRGRLDRKAAVVTGEEHHVDHPFAGGRSARHGHFLVAALLVLLAAQVVAHEVSGRVAFMQVTHRGFAGRPHPEVDVAVRRVVPVQRKEEVRLRLDERIALLRRRHQGEHRHRHEGNDERPEKIPVAPNEPRRLALAQRWLQC